MLVLVVLVLVVLVLLEPGEVVPDRRVVHRARYSQGPGKHPAARCEVQAAEVEVHPGTTSRQRRTEVRDEDVAALHPRHHHPQQP